jgi:exopolyphosphatase/guanosine-5'-triphosphate,3'-diphosphate pyrophosphatase
LRKATQSPVAALTADDEGRLAWEGAVARMDDPPEIVAVVDLGGGSCELAVGTPLQSPTWIRSVDAGALRVSRAFLSGNPPRAKRVAAARREISRLFDDFHPPRPDQALGAGGTARAVGRVVGRRFGVGQLEKLTDTLSSVPVETVTESHGVSPERAETLLGGTLVLTEVARRLDRDLEVSRGGLREGAALALARAEAAAA